MNTAIDSAQWTTLIPAAGRGSRLGFDRPKILYPVAGSVRPAQERHGQGAHCVLPSIKELLDLLL